MKKKRKFLPEKLVIGLILSHDSLLPPVKKALWSKFGNIDYESKIIDFTYTEYYKEEMGTDLKRCFLSFQKLISPEKLSDIKIISNRIEEKFSKNGKRAVNIDPGIMSQAKLILASTKDYSHRIPLKKGIFGEITLIYQNKDYRNVEWTYPDYGSAEYKNILKDIRQIYLKNLKQK